ncbi:MAG: hypothetical protein AAFP70_05575, partial [Calditrichota bacterium]
ELEAGRRIKIDLVEALLTPSCPTDKRGVADLILSKPLLIYLKIQKNSVFEEVYSAERPLSPVGKETLCFCTAI